MEKKELDDLLHMVNNALQTSITHPPIEYDQGKIVVHAQPEGLVEPPTVQLLGLGLESLSIQFDPHRLRYHFSYFGQNPYFLGDQIERHENGLAHMEWRYGEIKDLRELVTHFSEFTLTLEETLN